MTMNDRCSLEHCLSSGKYGEKKSGLNGDSNPDPWDAGAVLCQLSYQSNWLLCASIISPEMIFIDLHKQHMNIMYHFSGHSRCCLSSAIYCEDHSPSSKYEMFLCFFFCVACA